MVSLPSSPLEIWELGWKERSQKEDCLNDLKGTSSWILLTEETEGAGVYKFPLFHVKFKVPPS